jgi:hypothetical protein
MNATNVMQHTFVPAARPPLFSLPFVAPFALVGFFLSSSSTPSSESELSSLDAIVLLSITECHQWLRGANKKYDSGFLMPLH